MNNGNGLTMTGTIKYYNTDRGFGFIRPDDEPGEVFFHIQDTDLDSEQLYVLNFCDVTFDVKEVPGKGRVSKRAVNVNILDHNIMTDVYET